MTLLTSLLLGFASAGAVMVALMVAHTVPRLQPYRFAEDPGRSVSDAQLYRDMALNGIWSPLLIVAMAFGLSGTLFVEGETSFWVMAVEAFAVMYVYDFSYYFLHRFGFHEWEGLRGVHAVHHAARNPRAVDSFLLHPIETLLGLVALFLSIAAVGGVHLSTFAGIFVVYTTLNVFNHAGLRLPYFGLRTLGWLAEKHDRHHDSMLAGNYASITPLPDMVFDTVA